MGHKLWHVWRSTIRPRLLGIDVSAVSQDLLGEFKASGVQELQINGHLELTSPGDARIPVEEGAAYALASHEASLERIEEWRREHGEELAENGFSEEEFEEFIHLKRARVEYLKGDPARVREVMEVFTQALLYVKGTKPAAV